MGKRKSFDESFWPLVDKSGTCWLWRGAQRGGRRNQYGNWRGLMAHRVSWEVANGQTVPTGKLVCHKCDVPLCVNPDHLFVGSAQENALDMVSKGRKRTRLNWDVVRQIRGMHGQGIRQCEIYRALGLPQAAVSAVIRGESWREFSPGSN